MAAAEPRPISSILCASLLIFERGALLFGARAAADGRVAVAVAVTLLTGGAFLARTAAMSARVRRLETVGYDELLAAAHRPASGAFDTATLRGALVRGADARATLKGRLWPTLAGDAISLAVFAPFVLYDLSLGALACVSAGALTAAIVVISLRRAALALSEGAFALQASAFRAVYEGLLGREDISAAGASERYRAQTRERARAWAAQQLRASLGTGLLGRGPVVLAFLAGAGVYFALRPSGGLRELAPLGALLPAIGSALLVAAEWVQLAPRVREFESALAAPAEATGDARLEGMWPIQVSELSVHFGDCDALRDVDLRIDEPALIVLAGPNGSGKSTLVRALVALVRPSAGTISFGRAPLSTLDLAALRKRIAYLSQRPHLSAMATIREAMTFIDDASPDEMLAALDRVDVLPALRTHDSDEPLSVSVDDLSGGERQRVALARALLRKDAELYLFDEPDANLDRRGIERVVGILEELSTRAVVIVAAHTEELIAAADVVVRLDAGRVVTPPAPADSPQSPAPSTKAAS